MKEHRSSFSLLLQSIVKTVRSIAIFTYVKKRDILQVEFNFLPAETKEKKDNAAIRNVVPIPIMAAIFDNQMTDNTLRKRCEREFIITSLFEGLTQIKDTVSYVCRYYILVRNSILRTFYFSLPIKTGV